MANDMPQQQPQAQLSPSLFPPASSLPGKRTNRMQYSFGLGKRQFPIIEPEIMASFSPIASSTQSDMVYVVDPVTGQLKDYDLLMYGNGEPLEFVPLTPSLPTIHSLEAKRSRPQRFSFGLGKRSKEQLMFNDDDDDLNNTVLFEPSENNIETFNSDKRRVQPYGFGLGKRRLNQLVENSNKKIKKLTNFEDFMKRRYSFGLGKRSV